MGARVHGCMLISGHKLPLFQYSRPLCPVLNIDPLPLFEQGVPAGDNSPAFDTHVLGLQAHTNTTQF